MSAKFDLNPCPFCRRSNLSMELARHSARIICNECQCAGPQGRESEEFSLCDEEPRYTASKPQMSAREMAIFLWNNASEVRE